VTTQREQSSQLTRTTPTPAPHIDEQATGPLTPSSVPVQRITPHIPNANALELDAWTAERRVAWQQWLSDKMLQTGYAAERVDGRRTFYVTELATRSGINYHTILSWLQRGSQPSYRQVRRLAQALGTRSVVVAYKAGLVADADVIPILNGGAIPAPNLLRMMLTSFAQMPDGALRRTLERETQRMLTVVETLARELGWTDDDFGPMAAEVAIRELADDPTPIDDHLPYADPDNVSPQIVYPGPTARYTARPSDAGDTF
jgi:transcriptional regulator with XRE-family HTH domain